MTTVQMPKEFDQLVNKMITEGIMKATTTLSETFKFDLEVATRVLDLDSLKIERKRGPAKKESKKESKKSAKKASDDEKPKKKRDPTGYLVFSKETRAEVRAQISEVLGEDEKLKPQDVVRELAKRWKALEQHERDEWNTKAKTPEASDDELCLSDNE